MFNLRKYFLLLMKDQRNSVFDKVVKLILAIVSFLYGISINVIDAIYKRGVRKIFKSKIPVISVGNITLGGTGKTPFSVFAAEYMQSKQKKPAILIRGYGNDECRMLKDELSDIKVYVGQSRKIGALNAAMDGCDVIILDDGFQHRTLKRDLDILLVDGKSFFGNEKLFPRGLLRERLSSMKRADMLVLTKIDSADKVKQTEFIDRIKGILPDMPIITAKHGISVLTDVTGSVYPPEYLKEKKTLLVSGIGDPEYFSFLVKNKITENISCLDYPDHYSYDQEDVEKIFKKAKFFNAEAIITTKKDFVKMKSLNISSIEEKLFILNISLDIVDGKEELFVGFNRVISGKSA